MWGRRPNRGEQHRLGQVNQRNMSRAVVAYPLRQAANLSPFVADAGQALASFAPAGEGFAVIFRPTALALFCAAILFILVMAWMPQPPTVPGRDKLQHMAAFAALTLLYSVSFPQRSRLAVAMPLALFGALIEAVQWLPWLHRDCDLKDWIADLIAIGIAVAMVTTWRDQSNRGGAVR
jgi:hypothetical protein